MVLARAGYCSGRKQNEMKEKALTRKVHSIISCDSSSRNGNVRMYVRPKA